MPGHLPRVARLDLQVDRTRRLGFIHLPAREALPWSAKRWHFVLERMQSLCSVVFVGDLNMLLTGFLPPVVTLHHKTP